MSDDNSGSEGPPITPFKARRLPKRVTGPPKIPVQPKQPQKLRTPPSKEVPRLPGPYIATDRGAPRSRAPRVSRVANAGISPRKGSRSPTDISNAVSASATFGSRSTTIPSSVTTTGIAVGTSGQESQGSPSNTQSHSHSPSPTHQQLKQTSNSHSPKSGSSFFPVNLSNSSGTTTMTSEQSTPIVTFRARAAGPKCPFANSRIEFELQPGSCLCLNGKSGLGKTTLSSVLFLGSSHASKSILSKLDIVLEACVWDTHIPVNERCGALFQTTTLLDELTIAGNLQVALQQYYSTSSQSSQEQQQRRQQRQHNSHNSSFYYDEIKQLLDLVGLNFDRDAGKYPTELSGGMGRRASLALQLAQHKRVIVLDEPFTGLDYAAARSVAKELVHLRRVKQTALVLISHEPHLAKIVMDPDKTTNNMTITLKEPTPSGDLTTYGNDNKKKQPSLFGTTFWHRFIDRLMDYTLYSLPLIVLAFVACGLAISMLSADLLQRLDFQDEVLDLVDTQVRPLIKLLTGSEANALQMMGVRYKVQGLLNDTVPPAKASIYAVGMTKLFVLEIGPLLTALLLCGRIGGSYAGRVGTLHATSQSKLLLTLGISPLLWSLWPSLLAALIAAPLLTVMGTGVAVGLAAIIGPTYYGIGSIEQFQQDMSNAVLPMWRLKSLAPYWTTVDDSNNMTFNKVSDFLALFDQLWSMDLSVTYTPRYNSTVESVIEILTYPPVYHMCKAIIYVGIILGVAEGVAQWWKTNLTPRGVPAVITMSVVISGLLVILADWGFSQLWLLRY